MAQLPTTVATSTTAATVTVEGAYSRLHFINLGTTVVYVRSDGTAAVAAADLNYAVPAAPHEGVCIPVRASSGVLASDTSDPSTSFSVIAASGTPLVHITPAGD